MAQIKFNIGIDALTGKRLKYANNKVEIRDGQPLEFKGRISFHEAGNDADAIPLNQTQSAKRAIETIDDYYNTNGRLINTTTKLYVAPGTIGAVSLEIYLQDKALNSYPGVANADPFWKVIEGVCKEVIAIRQANGELPV